MLVWRRLTSTRSPGDDYRFIYSTNQTSGSKAEEFEKTYLISEFMLTTVVSLLEIQNQKTVIWKLLSIEQVVRKGVHARSVLRWSNNILNSTRLLNRLEGFGPAATTSLPNHLFFLRILNATGASHSAAWSWTFYRKDVVKKLIKDLAYTMKPPCDDFSFCWVMIKTEWYKRVNNPTAYVAD